MKRRNSHAPYIVTWWNIGNEMYGSGWFLMSVYTHLTGLVSSNRTDMNVLPVGMMFKLI